MKSIEVFKTTIARAETVWQAWMKASPWNHWDQSQDVQEGKKGHVVSKKGKSVPYKIMQIQENESLTILWKALFVRLFFQYKLEPKAKGCLICYKATFKGFFSWPVYLLLRKKLEKTLSFALKDFIRNVESK